MPAPSSAPRIAYLFSRYPVVSQTFCDSEMLALEAAGFAIEIGSLNRPPFSFRHERLDRLQAEIHYPPPPDILEAYCQRPEFREKLLPMVADHDERYGTSYKALTRARNAYYMAARFRQLGVQHVHVHFANRATHSALFLKRLGFPFSFTAHAQDFMFDLGSIPLLTEMVREAAFVVTVSDYSRDLLREMCGGHEEKIVRIYNGIELHDFAPSPIKQAAAVTIVSVGRLIEFKGFQDLIRAAAELKARQQPAQIRIVGEGPMRAELEALVAQLEVQDVVQLLGVRSQEEIKRELAAADVFVLPSIVDPVGASDILPTVITEAMACSLPVISTMVAGIPEMVDEGETGLLVEPGRPEELAAAICRLAADPVMRERMGRAGRLRAEQRFSFQATALVLGERFRSQIAAGDAALMLRKNLPIVYLTRSWRGDALLADGPGRADGVRWLALEACWAADSEHHVPSLREVETLPDASVVESLWLRRDRARQTLETRRSMLREHVCGEAFYAAARQAVYLADVLPRRGTRHLHARRSDCLLTVWLIKQLLPDLQISCAIEEEPTLPRSLLMRLLPDFALVSVSDDRLAQQSAVVYPDELQLRVPWQRAETRLGPIRVKRKVAAAPVDRSALERAFLKRIHSLLASAPEPSA